MTHDALSLFPEPHTLTAPVRSATLFYHLDATEQLPAIDDLPQARVATGGGEGFLQLLAAEFVAQQSVGLFPAVDVAAGALDLEAQEVLREHLVGHPAGKGDGVFAVGAGVFLAVEKPRQHAGTEAISVPATWTTS